MQTTPITAIIFDFGGVLINWDPRRVFQKYFPNDPRALDSFLEEIDFAGWNFKQDAGRSFSEGVAEHSARFPQYAHLIRAYDKEWEESIPGVIAGTVGLLPKLKTAGYGIYGLSNWSAEKFAIVRHRFDFFKLLDDIVVSGQVKLAKPDPAIFEILLQKAKRPAQECLLIDDSPANIEAAQELGFATIQFTSPEQLGMELERMGIL
jgi:2-haloacid dehalogenase